MKRVLALLIIISTLITMAAATGSATISQSDGVHFAFQAGTRDILLNGEERSLQAAPFIQDGVFYVPLREVSELCGGVVKYLPESRCVLVALPEMGLCTEPTFFSLQLETGRLESDGGQREVMPSVTKDGPPLVKNNTTFIPIGYFFRIHFGTASVDGEHAILYNIPYRAGIGPFGIEEDFTQLATEIKSVFYATGAVDLDENDPTARREIWTNGSVNLTLLSGSRYYPNGYRAIMGIEVFQDVYATDWGLRIGDREDHYHAMYLSYRDQFEVEFLEGRVSTLTFWSHH